MRYVLSLSVRMKTQACLVITVQAAVKFKGKEFSALYTTPKDSTINVGPDLEGSASSSRPGGPPAAAASGARCRPDGHGVAGPDEQPSGAGLHPRDPDRARRRPDGQRWRRGRNDGGVRRGRLDVALGDGAPSSTGLDPSPTSR